MRRNAVKTSPAYLKAVASLPPDVAYLADPSTPEPVLRRAFDTDTYRLYRLGLTSRDAYFYAIFLNPNIDAAWACERARQLHAQTQVVNGLCANPSVQILALLDYSGAQKAYKSLMVGANDALEMCHSNTSRGGSRVRITAVALGGMREVICRGVDLPRSREFDWFAANLLRHYWWLDKASSSPPDGSAPFDVEIDLLPHVFDFARTLTDWRPPTTPNRVRR